MNTVFDHYNFQVFIQSPSLRQTNNMTLVEAQVAPVAPPAPKIAKRKVKAAAKSEKVVKKLVKANAKGKKFPFNIFLTKNTH